MKSPSSCNVSKKRSAAISQRSSEDTAQHSFCYDAIFEGSELRLQLVAPKGAEIVVGWISKMNEHYGTIKEHDVLVAIGTTAVATLVRTDRLNRVTKMIAQSPRPLLITLSRRSARPVTRKSRKRSSVAISHHSSGATTVVTPPRPSSSASSTTTRPQSTTSTATAIACYDTENNTQGDAESQVASSHQVASSRHTQLDGEPPVAAVQVSSSSSSSSAAGVRNDVADIGAVALAAGVCDDDDDVTTVVQPAAAAAAVTATIDTNNTFDSNDDDDGAATATVVQVATAATVASRVDGGNTQVEPSVAMPLVVEDPETILLQNVDCYVSGLLASFKRTTLNKMVHEVLILYPQSEYAIENERPIIHQRGGGRGSKARCTYITFEWRHIKEVLRALGKNAPGCREFVKHFCDCFVKNVSNIGCTAIAKQGRWCGIRIYGPEAESSNHYDITRYLNWRDVSSLCDNPLQDCGLDVYAQSLGDDGKVHGSNKHHHVASFSVPSGGSIMMSKIATGCSGEGREVPLTLPTIHHEKTYFTHQSERIPCVRMALIVDFVELDKKKYQSFIQEKYIPDSLVFTDASQDELTSQFQQANTTGVRTIHQERWLVKYNELIEHVTLNGSGAYIMLGCSEKLNQWVHTQRTQYRFLQEKKNSNMTEERIELLNAIGFTWHQGKCHGKKKCHENKNRGGKWLAKYNLLIEHKKHNQSARAPFIMRDGTELGNWVKTQRTQYRLFQEGKNNNMTAERIQLLNEIGFIWSVNMPR